MSGLIRGQNSLRMRSEPCSTIDRLDCSRKLSSRRLYGVCRHVCSSGSTPFRSMRLAWATLTSIWHLDWACRMVCIENIRAARSVVSWLRRGIGSGGARTCWKGLNESYLIAIYGLTMTRKICIFHGRPLSVLRSDIDADLPRDHGDMQRAQLSSDVARMRASIYLTHKLEDYFNQMWGLIQSYFS